MGQWDGGTALPSHELGPKSDPLLDGSTPRLGRGVGESEEKVDFAVPAVPGDLTPCGSCT